MVGRLAGLWAPNGDLVTFVYDAGGRLAQKWFPNGVNTLYTYNPDNTLAQLKNRVGYTDSTILTQHDYTYDGAGNRQTHTERIGATTTPYRYAYDPLDRLVEVWNDATSTLLERDAYDPLGNRTAKTAGGSTLAYVYDAANQLTEIRQGSPTGTLVGSLSYDPNGNLVTKAEGATTTTLTYDGLNRLVQASRGTIAESYVYDGEGRRIRKTTALGTTDYLYSGPDIIAEYAGWATPVATYTHGPNMDDPLIRATASGAQYFHQDGLGSVVAVSNPAGTTDATARYDAWGNRVALAGTVPLYGYTGREPDDTGLVYYRARYYDPAVGRFVQRDPIGFAGGDINLYTYGLGNPIILTDPSGESWAGILYGGISGGVGGFITGLASGGWKGAAAGAAVGAVVGAAVGVVQPGLSRAVGTQAARLIVGGAASAVGQLGGNVANNQPLGHNFSATVMLGSAAGNVGIARLSGAFWREPQAAFSRLPPTASTTTCSHTPSSPGRWPRSQSLPAGQRLASYRDAGINSQATLVDSWQQMTGDAVAAQRAGERLSGTQNLQSVSSASGPAISGGHYGREK